MLFKKILSERVYIKKSLRLISTTTRTLRNFKNKTHYEILNLNKNCNQKEIREAFINLSKQLHPDKNKQKNSSENFARLNDAYNVLRNPLKRREYDFTLEHGNSNSQHIVVADQSFWENRDRSQDAYYRKKPYYGIPGLRKASNSTIVLLCLAFVALGVTLQMAVLNYEWMLRQEKLDKISKLNSEILSSVKKEASENGNEAQLEKLRRRSQLYTKSLTEISEAESSDDY